MASVKCLLAFVALAIVSSARVEAKQENLDEICFDIGFKVETLDIPFDNADEVFEIGKKILSKKGAESKKLSEAWDNVIHGAKCSESSYDEVALIARCMPYSDPLETFAAAARKYAEKCLQNLKPKDIEQKILSIPDDSSIRAARNFIGSDFLKIYRENNPEEQLFLHKFHGVPECCRAERGIQAIVKAVESNTGKSRLLFASPVNYLKDNLFTPCKNFKKALDDVVKDIWLVSAQEFIKVELKTLLQSMSDKAKDDIFRYHLCASLEGKDEQVKIAGLVSESIKK